MPSKSFLVSLLLTVAESEPLNLKQIQYHFLQGFIRPSGLERQTKQHLSSPNPCGCMFFNTQIEDFNQRPMFLNRNRDEGGSIHGPHLVMGAQPNTLDGFWPWLWMVQTVASSFLVPHYLYRLSIRCLFFLQGDSALHRCNWSPSALQSDADVFWTVDTVFILSVNGAKSDSSWFVSVWILQCSENNTTSIQAVLQILNFDLFLGEETRSQDTGQKQQAMALCQQHAPKTKQWYSVGDQLGQRSFSFPTIWDWNV